MTREGHTKGGRMPGGWLEVVSSGARPEELPALACRDRDLRRVLQDELAPLHAIGMTLMADPAMALRVLQRANAIPHRHFRAQVAMLEDAAHMLGTRLLLRMQAESLADEDALDGMRLSAYRRAAGRGVLAGMLAFDWAELDHDRFPSEVSLAALLNNLGELFLLAHGDARMHRYLEMVERRQVMPHEAEYVTLGESLEELGYILALRWGLPEMVRESMRARSALHARALCVMLATQTARHALGGWRHPALGTDLRLTARLLGLDPSGLVGRINRVLSRFNPMVRDYGLASIGELPIGSGASAVPVESSGVSAHFCLAPRADDYAETMRWLGQAVARPREEVLARLLRGLHRGLGLNRVVFAVFDPGRETLAAELLAGTDFEPAFNRFQLSLREAGDLARLLEVPGALWVGSGEEDGQTEVPAAIRELTGVPSFFLMSLWMQGRPLGLLYADRRTPGCGLSARCYEAFQALARQAEGALGGV